MYNACTNLEVAHRISWPILLVRLVPPAVRVASRGSAKADAGKQKPNREPWTAAWTGIIAP